MMEKMSAEHLRWINHYRYRWHEAVLRDKRVRKSPTALALAGHAMHRFRSAKGYAQFSATSAAKALNIPVRSIKRAAKLLWKLGWLTVSEADERRWNSWGANMYTLTGDVETADPGEEEPIEADQTPVTAATEGE